MSEGLGGSVPSKERSVT